MTRGARPALTVSRATARFLRQGHPWVRRDCQTRGLERLRLGEPCTLIDERGTPLAAALADPRATICARVFAADPAARFDPAAALGLAWDRRGDLHRGTAITDCYRIVHGEADGLPGLRVERFAEVLVVLVLSDCALPHVDAVCAALHARLPAAVIIIRDHRDDLRRAGVSDQRWTPAGRVAPPPPETEVLGRELGVRFPLRPFAGLATGLYVDQRAVRAWLHDRAPDARVLNLFAYTGAFSLSLLVAGARSAVDVDLAVPALERARRGAELNDVADRHRTVTSDCRAFLDQDRDTYDLIICDPPTSAQGAGGWVARRDYPGLVERLRPRLAPGGLLHLVCNAREAPDLRRLLAGLQAVPVPAPDADVPLSDGFPEGRPWLAAAGERRPSEREHQ